MRVRSMQMNDAHIYCSEEQFEQEFMAVIGLYLRYFEISTSRSTNAFQHTCQSRSRQEVYR